MLNLLPNEHWSYSPADLIQGFFTALSARDPGIQYIEIPRLGRCVAVRSARAAIMVALKALELPRGASVGIPLYCCPVVSSAVRAAGCRARFIDIDPETYCLSATDLAAKSNEVEAVIAVHMFGNVCDVLGLRKAAPGKPIIEDCAQALGSLHLGRPAGSFGDIAVFSFRSGKYLSTGEGGAVYCRETELKSRISKLISALPRPSPIEECAHVASTFTRSLLRRRPLWGALGARLWEAYSETVTHTSQSPLALTQVYETDRALAVRRLPLLAAWIERQRANADYYARNLKVDTGMLCAETPGAYFNRLQYPLLLPTTSLCMRLAAHLKENHISTSRPYKDITAIARTHYSYEGDCPQAEQIAGTVLVIPCHHAINAMDLERTATSINCAWQRLTPAALSAGVLSSCRQATSSGGHSSTERIV